VVNFAEHPFLNTAADGNGPAKRKPRPPLLVGHVSEGGAAFRNRHRLAPIWF